MIVCHCQCVSDRTIRAAIADGATNEAQVAEKCGAGTGCGGCIPAVTELLDEARCSQRPRHLPVLSAPAMR